MPTLARAQPPKPTFFQKARGHVRKMLGYEYWGWNVGWPSPSQGQYEGAAQRRRLRNWQPGEDSINALTAYDGRLLRRRSRDLVRNNPIIVGAVESFVANAIGVGIRPSPSKLDNDTKTKILESFEDWQKCCDTSGMTDFYGLQALVGRALFEAGEIFIRFRARSTDYLSTTELTVPLQLELLESEMLPYERNQTAPNGNRIINGVEFDRRMRRQAYWFYRQHPGDIKIFGMNNLVVRVPAEQVLHVFRPVRPGQVRGVPWTSPSMVRSHILDQYDDAELDRKKTAAMFAGFITSPEADVLPETNSPAFPYPYSGLGELEANLEPGTLQVLMPGEQINFSAPVDVGGTYDTFQYRNLLAICGGIGVPYMNVTGDITKANYSSLRGGIIEYRRRLALLQRSVIIHQLCRPVWQRWICDAVLAGVLELPDFVGEQKKYYRTRWITPAFEWVDPVKDVEAEKIAVDNLFKSRSDVIEGLGEDPEETDQRIKADQDRADELGLQRQKKDGTPISTDADKAAEQQKSSSGFGDGGGGEGGGGEGDSEPSGEPSDPDREPSGEPAEAA
jgi:lambda family phage portal protein